jgi:predicted O-methyltransferase YrrM
MTNKPDRALVDQVKGFMDPEEGARLYEVALEAGKMGPLFEIGSYCGKSTLYLGSACKENGTVLFSLDHHRGSEEQQPGEAYFDPELFDEKQGKIDTCPHFRKTLSLGGLEDTVVAIVGRSSITARFWQTPISLLFIDGGHTFEAAFNDYNSWSRHILPGGFLVIHDIFETHAEGGQAPHYVYDLAKASGLYEALPMTKTLGILRKYAVGEKPANLPVY